MPKFLVVRFSSIGDIVLCTPVIRCLKQQVKGAEVHVATKTGFAPLLSHNPHVSKLQLLGADWKTFVAACKAEGYDHIIDLHHNLRTRRLAWALGIPAQRFNKLNWEKWLLTALKIDRMPPLHIVDRLLQTVAPFGVQNDGQGLDFFIAPENREPALPAGLQPQAYTALVIGAALETKQLPLSKLVALAGQIQGPVLLMGGKEDAANAQAILQQVARPDLFDACGRYSLQQSAQLLTWSQRVITHDTGLMHIAAALRKPIVSVWGNTVPAFGMTPYYPTDDQPLHRLHEVAGLACRPCSKIGHHRCPRGHFKCMNEQNLAAIAQPL